MNTGTLDSLLGHVTIRFVLAGAAALVTLVIFLDQPAMESAFLAICAGVGAAIPPYFQNR